MTALDNYKRQLRKKFGEKFKIEMIPISDIISAGTGASIYFNNTKTQTSLFTTMILEDGIVYAVETTLSWEELYYIFNKKFKTQRVSLNTQENSIVEKKMSEIIGRKTKPNAIRHIINEYAEMKKLLCFEKPFEIWKYQDNKKELIGTNKGLK